MAVLRLFCLLALVAGSAHARVSYAPKELSITVLEKSTKDTRDLVMAVGVATPGDRFLWHWEVVTPKMGRKVGFSAGMCTTLFSGLSSCSWTAFLKKGTITASGVVDETKIKNVVPIVGGTGIFSGATGNVSEYTLVSNPTQNDFQYLQTFNLRLPDRPREKKESGATQ